MNTKLNQALESSKNPAELSLTIKGLLLAVVPIVLSVVNILGITTLDETTLTNLTESLIEVVTAVTALVSAGTVAWGLLRKLWY